MGTANIFFGKNVKYLRERKKLTQEQLASKIGLSRVKLNALENGITRSPRPEDYLNASNFFSISIDALLRIDLKLLGELKVRELEAGNDVYIRGGSLRVLAITVDTKNRENVEYVPIKAKAGYAANFSDPEFIAALPRYSMPNLPRNGTFRTFTISGNSMLPIADGSDVTGQYVQDWNELKPDTACIVVLDGQQDIVFKMVTIASDGKATLRSLNHEYEPYQVGAGEILEIWKFHSYTTRTVPSSGDGNMDYVVRTLAELKGALIK